MSIQLYYSSFFFIFLPTVPPKNVAMFLQPNMPLEGEMSKVFVNIVKIKPISDLSIDVLNNTSQQLLPDGECQQNLNTDGSTFNVTKFYHVKFSR